MLQNSGIVFAVPFSVLLLGDRKKYLTPTPLAIMGLVGASIAVSVLPTILEGHSSDGFSGGRTFAWVAIYLLGIVPGALYNTVQQLFLLRSGALQPDVSADLVTRATLRMLFWCNLWQAFWLVALFFLDLLPFFGFSTGLSDFWTNTLFSLTCSFGGRAGAVGPDSSQCVSQWGSSPNVWAFSFAVAYSISYIGSAQLNRESSTFNLLVAVITSSATAAFFLIPGCVSGSGVGGRWEGVDGSVGEAASCSTPRLADPLPHYLPSLDPPPTAPQHQPQRDGHAGVVRGDLHGAVAGGHGAVEALGEPDAAGGAVRGGARRAGRRQGRVLRAAVGRLRG